MTMAKGKKRTTQYEETIPFAEFVEKQVTDEMSIIQPVTVTIMRQGFSKIQNRALICVIDKLQSCFHDLLNGRPVSLYNTESSSKEKVSFKIALNEFGVDKNNYKALREALKKLPQMPIEIPYKSSTGKLYDKFTNLCNVLIPKDRYSNYVIIEIDKDVANRLINRDFGYQNLFKSVILHKCSNKYSQRIYMMITAWKKKQSFEITTSEFRKILMIEKKYPEFRLLAYNVLEPARKELEELALAGKSDCYFTYEKLYRGSKHTKEPDKIAFKVIESPKLANEETAKGWGVKKNYYRDMLMRHFNLKESESEEYASMLTVENYASALECMMNIMNYANSNTQRIFDRRKYIITSLDNFFKKAKMPIVIDAIS